jgi:starch-binding outer membrane protein, SusD/RagB family
VLQKKILILKKSVMKNIIKLSILATTIMLFSCGKDYLNLDPKNSYTYYSFPKNEDQVSQAVVACYNRAYAIHNTNLWVFGEYMSDNTSFRFNPTDRGGLNTEAIDEHVMTADNGTILAFWTDTYDGIERSNYVLNAAETITFRSDSVKGMRIAEAKFWRAWHYFNLVQLYGDVPLITKVLVTPSEGPKYQREPVSKIYNELIYPDALDAVAKLPTTVNAANKGRLTKGAAIMLLAKAYMVQKRFGDAATQLNALLTHGYSLNANYLDNFDPTKKNGKESILEMQSDATLAVGFGFGPSWTPWGTNTLIWPNASNSRGGLNQPTADLSNAYEAADTMRKNTTVGTVTVSNVVIPYMKKFIWFDVATKTNPVNFPTYRYADALLMLAECLNEQGFGNPLAFTYLNQVRSRAKLAAKTQGNAVPTLAVNDQAAFRLAIEKERQVELAGENHRWFDLVRTGRLEAVMTAHAVVEKAAKSTVVPTAYTKIRPLIAIPSKEALQWGYTQNAGW